MPLLAAELPVPQHEPGAARDSAREILARREFLPEPRSLLERIVDWFNDLIADVLGAVGDGPTSVVAVVLSALIVVLLAWVLVRVFRSTAWRSGAVVAGAESGDVGRSAQDWLADAASHEAAGEWRDAIRCRYRALVAELTRRGLVEEVPGRTSGEYRYLVRSSLPSGAPPFAAASDSFDRAWYGRATVGPDDVARLRAAADDVLRVAA